MAVGPCWVKCEVWLGMFSNEYCIAIGEKHPGGFAEIDHVRTEHAPMSASSTPGEVRGVVLEEDDKHCLVRVAWKSLGSECVRVPKAEVNSL